MDNGSRPGMSTPGTAAAAPGLHMDDERKPAM